MTSIKSNLCKFDSIYSQVCDSLYESKLCFHSKFQVICINSRAVNGANCAVFHISVKFGVLIPTKI